MNQKHEAYGPPLPPKFQSDEPKSLTKEDKIADTSVYGPPLPPTLISNQNDKSSNALYGPSLPPEITKTMSDGQGKSQCGPELPPSFTSKVVDTYGPPLPPALKQSVESVAPLCGPELPKGIKEVQFESSENKTCVYGPPLPPGLNKAEKSVTDSRIKSPETVLLPAYEVAQPESKPAVYGAQLPPHLDKSKSCENKPLVSSARVYGAALPPTIQTIQDTEKSSYGPDLPPSLKIKSQDASRSRATVYGAELPPGFLKETSEYGAELPPSMKQEGTDKVRVYGASMPPGFLRTDAMVAPEPSNSDLADESEIGPLLPGNELREEIRHFRSNQQNESTKGAGGTSGGGLKREAWMTELPTGGPSLSMGLTARKFRTDSAVKRRGGEEESRMLWTATPGQEGESAEQMEALLLKRQRQEVLDQEAARRDMEMQAQVEKYNEEHKRNLSLVQMKEKKRLKKEKKKKKKKARSRSRSFSPTRAMPTRKPFDRDQDLRVGGMDDSSRKSFISHTKDYGSRFGHGKQKFND